MLYKIYPPLTYVKIEVKKCFKIFSKRNGERRLGDISWKEEVFNTFKLNSNFGIILPTSLTYRHTDTNI